MSVQSLPAKRASFALVESRWNEKKVYTYVLVFSFQVFQLLLAPFEEYACGYKDTFVSADAQKERICSEHTPCASSLVLVRAGHGRN